MVKSPLQGLSVLVTRPRDQAEALTRTLEDTGIRVVRFPLLEIQPVADGARAGEQLASLARFNIVVFVSQNAVGQALTRDAMPPKDVLRGLQIWAIGRATAQALEEAGISVTLVPPSPFTTESLLRLLEPREMAGKRIAIVCGVGGRDTLARTLTEWGATVEYIELYRRVAPTYAPEQVREALESSAVDLILITSAEAVKQLHELAQHAKLEVADTPLLVASARIAEVARGLGFDSITVADDASDAAMVQAIETWWSRGGKNGR